MYKSGTYPEACSIYPMIKNLKLIGLSTYQKKDSREGVNITVVSISKAYLQMPALTRAPSRTSKIQISLHHVEV